jgi:hypothetical protein
MGEEVQLDIRDGDKYNDEKTWKWIVDDHVLGIYLNDKYEDLDDNNLPLGSGDKLCTPNEYVCMEFNGISSESTESYTFEYDVDDGVRVDGNFYVGIEDYSTIYILGNKIYDDDMVQIATGTITLGETDLTLKANVDNTLEFENIKIGANVTSIVVDGDDVSGKDTDVRSVFGTIVSDPENNLDDNQAEFEIPDEDLLSSLKICGK